MKKYAFFFLIIIFLVNSFNTEEYFSRILNSMSFLVILIYSINLLINKKDSSLKEIFKNDKLWVGLLILALIYDIYSEYLNSWFTIIPLH